MNYIKNDLLLQETFKSEMALIPFWLRLTKAKKVAAGIIELSLLTSIAYAVNSMLNSHGTIPLYMFFVIPLAVLLPVWFKKASHEELTAFKTASYTVSLKRYHEKSRFTPNRISYCDPKENAAPVVFIPATFCPKCGLLLVEGEKSCRTCGSFSKFGTSSFNLSEYSRQFEYENRRRAV